MVNVGRPVRFTFSLSTFSEATDVPVMVVSIHYKRWLDCENYVDFQFGSVFKMEQFVFV